MKRTVEPPAPIIATKSPQVEPEVDNFSGKTDDRHQKADDEKHRKTEEHYWRFSLLVSVVIAITTIIGLMLAYLAWREARQQAQAALATSRPWVTIDASLSKPLRLVSAGIHISVDGIVHNVGHSPALKVKDALFAVVGEDSLASVERTCETLSDVPFANVGRVLFSEDVDKASSSQLPIKMHLTFMLSALHAVTQSNKDDQPLSVVACVVYDFGDGIHHHTLRIMDLNAPDIAGNALRLTARSQVAKGIPILVDRTRGDRIDYYADK